MTKVKDFISKLNDYELAYFSKYKLHTYLKESQSEIKEYLAERGLNQSKIEKLTSENLRNKYNDDNSRCTRCYSSRLRVEKVEWTNTTDEYDISVLDALSGKAYYKNKVICNICGLWLTDPNNEKGKSFWDSVWNYILELISRI